MSIEESKYHDSCKCGKQTHVHEVVGSVEIEGKCDPHNHRFATVTDEVIRTCKSHIHEIKFRTDFYDDHYHEFCGRTSEAIPVGDGRHVHFLKSVTTENDGHKHKFRVATLIENPIEDKCK
ncbi:MAG: YmaF family protein [Bacillota bacterium]|nr:YmaF family protein [Bacillota bacterium]